MRPHVRRVKCIIRFFTLSAGSLVLLSVIIMKESSIKELTELDKCPACYGVTFCPAIDQDHIQLSLFSSWFNAKNVHFAHTPHGLITLKKLGHDWELTKLDKYICNLMGHELNDDCVITDIIWKIQDVRSSIFNVIHSNTSIRSGFTFCPAIEATQLDEIIDRVSAKSKGIGYKTLLINILTTVIINPEPIILQCFPGEEGWPFPQLVGSCGRLVVEEYRGHSLTRLVHAPWLQRANVALQLLQIARQLTFQDAHFALYLTDLSLDNIVVDSLGKVSIVDLGNCILVDKHPPLAGRGPSWSEMHTSDNVEDCDSCFSFSTDDVCSHHISDHNYYAVCQLMAMHSWLSDIPNNIALSYPQLQSLLRECHSPEMNNGRYIAVRHLIPILANVTTWQPR